MFENLVPSSVSTERSSSHQSNPNGGARSVPSDLYVEPSGLYIVLWSRGETSSFHWGLYLAKTEELGVIYHQINEQAYFESWRLSIEERAIWNSQRLLAALKVGVYSLGTDPDAVQYLTDTVRGVKRGLNGTCRTWVMDALFEIADSGLIDMQPDATNKEAVEWEATALAMQAATKRSRLIGRSEHIQV